MKLSLIDIDCNWYCCYGITLLGFYGDMDRSLLSISVNFEDRMFYLGILYFNFHFNW